MLVEVFRTIPGFGDYQVSNLGRVRSQRLGPWKLMKGGRVKNQMAYFRVTLVSDHGIKTCKYIHRLVLSTFKPRRDFEGEWVLHRDGNPDNNALDNLYWGDPAQNVEDKLRHGWSAVGEVNPNSRLSSGEVCQIRNLYGNGSFNQVELSSIYGVAQAHISKIVRNESWVM